ncbi:MAG: hypothetical protein ACOCYC_00175 [bacterium]
MWRRIAFALVLAAVSSLVAAQDAGPADAGPAEAVEAGDATTYTGIWSARFGPVTLEWILEEEQYEFYAYQEQSIRVGSRGSITVDDGEITFVSEETTTDGEEWNEVDLPEEERSAAFGLILQEDALRLAEAERSQFYVEYRSREESVQEQAREGAREEENGGGAAGAADADDEPANNEE